MQCHAVLEIQVSGQCPAQRPSRSDHDRPLQTAGDRCLWHAGGTAGENGDAPHLAPAAPSLARRVRPVLGDDCIVGKSPEGSRQIGHQALNLSRVFSPRSRKSAVMRLSRSDADSSYRLVLPGATG